MIQLEGEFRTVEPQEMGEYVRPPAGAYVLKVIAVSDAASKSSGAPMLTLDLDIAEGEFKGTFEKFPLKLYQLCTKASLPYLKGLLTAFKNSNASMPKTVENNVLKPDALLGLRIAGNLREEEYKDLKTGEIKIAMRIAYVRSIDSMKDMPVLPLKTLPKGKPMEPFKTESTNVTPGGVDPNDNLPWE